MGWRIGWWGGGLDGGVKDALCVWGVRVVCGVENGWWVRGWLAEWGIVGGVLGGWLGGGWLVVAGWDGWLEHGSLWSLSPYLSARRGVKDWPFRYTTGSYN